MRLLASLSSRRDWSVFRPDVLPEIFEIILLLDNRFFAERAAD
jgi:hypothetical protein